MRNIQRTVERIRAFRKSVFDRRTDSTLLRRSLSDVRRVAVINSSSRSGSSLLYALLGRHPNVYSLTGEAAPFYKLNTSVTGFSLFESDKIPTALLDTVIDYDGLSRDFLSDCSCAGEGGTIATAAVDVAAYADDLMLRFALQWTDVEFDPQVLRRTVETAFERYARRSSIFHTQDFYLHLLQEVVAAYPAVNPFYYDISTDRVALHFPHTDVPAGPPNSWFNIEEPPFILLPPLRRPVPVDLDEKTLLLKSTVDCYRMNLIERLFPQADIRIIHLVRNPAATTNGIYDGWLHRGFFSHNLQPFLENSGEVKELRIRGYSDRYAFGRYWWNFDLPEGWQRLADSDLIEVCAFQWDSANTEILQFLGGGGRTSCRVHFEDIIRNLESRTREFGRMLDFLGLLPESASCLGLDAMPVVQSTLPPQLYRWKKRGDIIGRLLGDPQIVAMSEELGYSTDNLEGWL